MSGWLPAESEPGLISVVVPTYNRAGLLAETLGSILAQDCERLEVLLVDDGSEDATSRVAAEWRERFRAERGWRLECLAQEHGGGQRARNLGARESRGEFLCFLDDDDLLARDRLRGLLAAAREKSAGLAYGPWAYFVHDGNGYGLRAVHNRDPRSGDEAVLAAWLKGWSWYVMGALLARDLLNRVGPWNRELRLCQDLEFSARCFAAEPVMAHSAEGLLYRRQHAGTISRRSFSEYEDTIVAFASAIEKLALEKLPAEVAGPAIAQYLGSHAVRFFAKGSRRGARFCEEKVLEHDPGYRPRTGGVSSRLAFALGGFRLWSAKNRLRDRFKRLGRRIRGKDEGFNRVPELAGVDLSGAEDV